MLRIKFGASTYFRNEQMHRLKVLFPFMEQTFNGKNLQLSMEEKTVNYL